MGSVSFDAERRVSRHLSPAFVQLTGSKESTLGLDEAAFSPVPGSGLHGGEDKWFAGVAALRRPLQGRARRTRAPTTKGGRSKSADLASA